MSIIDNALQILTTASEKGEDIWETALSLLTQDESDMDVRRWRQGDVALLIEKHYSENRLGDFARAAKMPVKTLYERRQMSAFYSENSARQKFDTLYYSHYRAAMRLGNLDAALNLLSLAQEYQWTVSKTAIEVRKIAGKTVPAKKLLDIETKFISAHVPRGTMEFSIRGVSLEAVEELAKHAGYKLRLVVYEAEPIEDEAQS